MLGRAAWALFVPAAAPPDCLQARPTFPGAASVTSAVSGIVRWRPADPAGIVAVDVVLGIVLPSASTKTALNCLIASGRPALGDSDPPVDDLRPGREHQARKVGLAGRSDRARSGGATA